MLPTQFDLLTISRAFVDVIADVPEEFLKLFGLKKAVVIEVTSAELLTMRSHLTKFRLYAGGSMANTAVGMAALGAKTAFIGKVANDEEGRFFRQAFRQVGVVFPSEDHPPAKNAMTGTNLVLKTPDGMGTVISATGIADRLSPADIVPELIESAKLLYLEANHFMFRESRIVGEAASMALHAGRQVVLGLQGLDLENPVRRQQFQQNCPKHVDITLGNRREFSAILDVDKFESYRSGHTLLVMTDGPNGVYLAGQEQYLHVPPHRLGYHPNTVGAGDQFAAGFLFGYLRRLPLRACLELGSETADAMLALEGARPLGGWQDIARRYVG
jgi:adenosine kinase